MTAVSTNKLDGNLLPEKIQMDTALSCVSFKSSQSMLEPIVFKVGDLSTAQSPIQCKCPEFPKISNGFIQSIQSTTITSTYTDLRDDLQRYHPDISENVAASLQRLKSRLKAKFECIYDNASKDGHPALLSDIYTELYITEAANGNVNNEHEVRQIERAFRRQDTEDRPILCNDIFKSLPGVDKLIRVVLTKGVAGIGKTVSVQKFILDWAEGKANQDICCICPLPFRELNLLRGKKYSLTKLLGHMMEYKHLSGNDENFKVLFILDGLDECRFPLDFQNNKRLCDVTQSATVGVLLTNLIMGHLLPSALLWITSRPAAASQIPPECVDQVTEVRGFSDPQKEEYLRKRVKDKKLAHQVISHVKSSRSLYIMCHIPVFCWLSATVLERKFEEEESGEIPKTLTQMYTHFLSIQIKTKNQRYSEDKRNGSSDENMILKLGKLAFQQLEKGNLIFYEEDLWACGIDVQEAAVYSGVCSQIFREEYALVQSRVYCFVHLSIQEFLAAVYVFFTCKNNNNNVFDQEAPMPMGGQLEVTETTMHAMHKCAIDKALQSENGRFDLFLRFLLGLSLDSNQTLLHGLIKQVRQSSHSHKDTVEYIKRKIEESSSPERSINLFHCLNELNELSLVKEVQRYLSSGHFGKLSSAQWSALVFVLLTSEEKLDVFDLKNYVRSDEGLQRLLPVVKASETALLDNCGLTRRSCKALASVVSCSFSSLRVLDLSSNSVGDAGVRALSLGLGNRGCKLETLRLRCCRITPEGCGTLASDLLPHLPHLKELDLRENSLRQSGVMLLSTYLKNPHCKLEILGLKDCRVTPGGSIALASALKANPSHLRELDLHWNNPGDNGVEQLSAIVEDPHSKLETLWLTYGLLTEKCCEPLASALRSSSAGLRALDLSGNMIGDTGVQLLSTGLESSRCTLETMRLACCGITKDGCAALAVALMSNPAKLKELDLSKNSIGDAGVQALSTVLSHQLCKLETLRLKECVVTEEGCAKLASALCSHPTHMRLLDLSNNNLRDAGLTLLAAVLDDAKNTIQKLLISHCALTMDCCSSLASALSRTLTSLQELDISGNDIQDLGVNKLCSGLKSPNCKLEILRLVSCGVTKEACTTLALALSPTSSQLRELDLSENELGDSDVKQLSALQDSQDCTLETVHLY